MASTNPRARKRKEMQCQKLDRQKKRRKIRSKNPNFIPLGKNKILAEMKIMDGADVVVDAEDEELAKKKKKKGKKGGEEGCDSFLISTAPAAQQLRFFLDRFQFAYRIKLSPLEVEAFRDTCMVELTKDVKQDVENFSKHIKAAFGTSWKEVLSEGKLSEGTVDTGSPALIIISTSALRSLELLRGLKALTRECPPAKLFAKHMKVEDQVSSLKRRVNIASGTPSRIKKLIDMEALSLSRLDLVVLDMQRDVKGYSLFTLPQISAEFWDLYKSHLQQRLLQGDVRICFYGAVLNEDRKKDRHK